MENASGVELMECACSYRMLTQMDVLRYLKAHDKELTGILERPVNQLGAVADVVYGVFTKTKVIDALRSMNRASLNAVPIVEPGGEDHQQLINVSSST